MVGPRVPKQSNLPTTLGSENYELMVRLTRWTLKDLLRTHASGRGHEIAPEPRRPDCDIPRSSPRKRIDSTSVRAAGNVRQTSFLSDGKISYVCDRKNR